MVSTNHGQQGLTLTGFNYLTFNTNRLTWSDAILPLWFMDQQLYQLVVDFSSSRLNNILQIKLSTFKLEATRVHSSEDWYHQISQMDKLLMQSRFLHNYGYTWHVCTFMYTWIKPEFFDHEGSLATNIFGFRIHIGHKWNMIDNFQIFRC